MSKSNEFTIFNDNIREEFDAVKNYFGNALGVKKIKVHVIIKFLDGDIKSIDSNSSEIARIDQSLIDSVKFELVKSFLKPKIEVETDKTLLTMDEVFDNLTDEKVKANLFYDNENQLIDDLLLITNTKHYKHLRYLSSKHAHSILKLRFVIKPFSFIFLLEGENNFHIIWETLNTKEATYIWYVDKDHSQLNLSLKKIDAILHAIKIEGKTAYFRTTEDRFRRIYHDYSELVDGFIKWKGEIESVLT